MKDLFFYWIILFLSVILLVSCNDSIKKRTDRDEENLHGEVCLTITEEFRKDASIGSVVKKFNRSGNYIYVKSKSSFKTNEWTTTSYSYDPNGKLQVIKEDGFILSLEGGFINQSNYKKFQYDSQGKLCKIREYTNSDENLTSVSSIERTDFGIKIIRNDPKYDFVNKYYYDDVIVIEIYKDKSGKRNKVVELKGKRVLETSYGYNEYGQRTKIHKKDKVVFVDSTIVYDYSDKTYSNPKYMYQKVNTNIEELFEYDKWGNIIHYNKLDKTHNEELEEYYEYVYDDQGNWTEYYVYDSLHELKESYLRKIVYYPSENGVIDYSWEQKDPPSLTKYYYEKKKEEKRRLYLQDDFVLKQFYNTMNQEYSEYHIDGEPKIIYKLDSIYHINFNGYYYKYGMRFSDNYTIKITMCIDADSYNFEVLKGSF